jgi:hypothetical protein
MKYRVKLTFEHGVTKYWPQQKKFLFWRNLTWWPFCTKKMADSFIVRNYKQ